MSCGITGGLDILCENLSRVGGVKKTAYLYNIDDLDDTTPYTFDSNGFVNAINFKSYKGLYKFTGRKQSHSGGYTAQILEGGNKFFQQDVTMKNFADNPIDDQVLESLLVATVGVILETNNNQFKLYGAYNGLEESAGSQNSGTTDASDISDQVTLTGSEQTLPKRVFDGTSHGSTKAYLETLVV